MLKRIGIAIAVIVVIIVVAAAVAPWFVGGAAEANFKAQVARLNARLANRGLRLHVDSYHRGWYSSGADISLSAAPGRMDKGTLKMWAILFGSTGVPEFHLHINHGPVPFDAFGYGHWNFMPVLYTAEFQGKELPALSFIGALKPTVYIVESFTGSTHSRLTVPPGRFSLGIAGAKWQGGHLVVDSDAALDRMHDKGVLKPITFQFMNPKSRQEYSGKFAGLKFSGKGRKAQHGFWTGTQKYALKGLSVDKDNAQIVKFASGQTRVKSSETNDGRWFNFSGQLTQSGGKVHGWSWSKLSLSGAIEKLDAASLSQALRHSSGSVEKGVTPTVMPDNGKFFFHYPSSILRALSPETQGRFDFALEAPDGQAQAHATLSFKGLPPTAATASAKAAIAQHADFRMTLDFDRKLVMDYSREVLGPPSAASVGEALQAWVTQGYLQTKAGSYSTVIRYSAGVLTVNGRTVSDSAATSPRSATAGGIQSAPVPATGP